MQIVLFSFGGEIKPDGYKEKYKKHCHNEKDKKDQVILLDSDSDSRILKYSKPFMFRDDYNMNLLGEWD